MNKQKQAFTLVELIVVITILAILGTIAFISLQWYSSQARDSTRISDLASIKSSLELFQVEAGKYPQSTNGINVTYSWSTVWSQWTFWETVYANVEKLDKIPTDPLTDNQYTYSVTTIKTEYQLWGILEWDEVSFSSAASSPLIRRIRPLGHPVERGVLNTETNAWETTANAIVTWNYNWVITKTNSWTLCNILATPSIITNDTSVTDLQQIVTNNSFVYRWYKNLPGSFAWSKFKQDWWFTFQPNNLVAYTDNNNCWDITAKTSSGTTARVQLLKWLQDAYTWTILKDVWEIKNIMDLVIDTNNPSQEVINYAWNFVNNNLGGDIIANAWSSISPTVPVDVVDFETEWWYTVTTWTFTRSTNDVNQGIYSIESENNTDNSSSCFEITRTKTVPFNVIFDYNVSSEEYSDELVYSVDWLKINWFSWDTWWDYYSEVNPAGTYTFRWCYEKNVSWSALLDKAWIDNIRFVDVETYEVSWSLWVNWNWLAVNICWTNVIADASWNFSVNIDNYTVCNDLSVTSSNIYACYVTTNWPELLTSNISNISWTCVPISDLYSCDSITGWTTCNNPKVNIEWTWYPLDFWDVSLHNFCNGVSISQWACWVNCPSCTWDTCDTDGIDITVATHRYWYWSTQTMWGSTYVKCENNINL
jgi:prepilin-type N-terminal cleavage/methylation domain-containing protein